MKRVSGLNEEQNAQLIKQWENNQHNDHEVSIDLSGQGDSLDNFLVCRGVLNPTSVTSRYCASYLYYNNKRLFADKTVIDMGCGSGLLGLVMALYGAKSVIFSDISRSAFRNTKENIARFKIKDKSVLLQGDLFEKISEKVDLIVFNHPFFTGNPFFGGTIASSMLAPVNLIQSFLKEAPKHLNEGGFVLMPYYAKAGDTNDPAVQGLKYGFEVVNTFKVNASHGLQTGEIKICELFIKD